jgi:hypothetical protein
MVRCESRPSTIGHITLGTKQTGAPSAGNPHAGCDVAGAGNGFTVRLLRRSQRKREETARLDLRNTAPVLDPTRFAPRWSRLRHPVKTLCHPGFQIMAIRLDNRPAILAILKSAPARGWVEDPVRIPVAWPLNEEIISARPTLIRVSREAAGDEETASSVH